VSGYWRRHAAAAVRWLHIYLSMISFALLFFFAVTGLTLNHPDWFGEHTTTTQHQGRLNAAWVKGPEDSVAKLEIVEHLRRAHGVKGLLGEFRIEDTQCAVSFKGPGYTADALIRRDTGDYSFSETRLGLVAVINDLHKGRDSGRGWSVVVDISAVLMVLVSLSGFALIFFLKRRRTTGLLAASIGAALGYLAFRWFV
jgi:hypothetical protein